MAREQLSDLFHEAAQITRKDVFGSGDELRPVYLKKDNILTGQIDVPSVGMVGPEYDGSVVILSVNGAGAKDNVKSLQSSDRMYAALCNLRDAAPGASAQAAFEALNLAVIASVPDWGVSKQHILKILEAVHKSVKDIAYLYLVPFRTRDDKGSTMNQKYFDAGYDRHLARQLRALTPKVIIAIDRPSECAARRFQIEAPQTEVIYYTRKRDAHVERKATLAYLALRNF